MVGRPKAKAILVMVLVFLLGGIAGAAGAHALGKRRMAELVSDDREELRERRRLRALRRALDLTDTQAEQVSAALSKHRQAHRAAMDAMFEECGDPLTDVRDALDADIRAILTPEQQARFEKIRQRHRRGFFGRRGRHRRPHGPGGQRGSRPPPP